MWVNDHSGLVDVVSVRGDLFCPNELGNRYAILRLVGVYVAVCVEVDGDGEEGDSFVVRTPSACDETFDTLESAERACERHDTTGDWCESLVKDYGTHVIIG